MINSVLSRIRVHFRELTNPILGPIRRRKLSDTDFTIISNNCWGGHVYRWFAIEYKSPTIGLYFFSDEYVRFVSKLDYYLGCDLSFIPIEESKYYSILLARNTTCPIGKLDDVEIVFLHYKSNEEAYEKWNRRKARINRNHLLFKMSEQNLCSIEALKAFDSLPYKGKICFTTKKYGLSSEIVFDDARDMDEIPNDTVNFRKRVNLALFINNV